MGRRNVYALIAVFVTSVGLAVANVAYTDHVDRQAERRNLQRSREICGIIVLIDDRNQAIKPTSEEQRRFIEELHRYRVALGC